jgi:Ca2+-binding RTX toxin-like protein
MGVFRGTANADRFEGTDANDTFYGFGDDDYLDGGGGRNTLFGDTGKDTIVLSAEGDTLAIGGNISGGDNEKDTYIIELDANGTIRGFEPGIDVIKSRANVYDSARFEDTPEGVVIHDYSRGHSEVLVEGVTEDELLGLGSFS